MRVGGYILSASLVYMSISGIVMGILLMISPSDSYNLRLKKDIVTNNLRAYSTFFGFMVFCHGLILYAAMYTATRNRLYLMIFGIIEMGLWIKVYMLNKNEIFNAAFFPSRYTMSMIITSLLVILTTTYRMLMKLLKKPKKQPQLNKNTNFTDQTMFNDSVASAVKNNENS